MSFSRIMKNYADRGGCYQAAKVDNTLRDLHNYF